MSPRRRLGHLLVLLALGAACGPREPPPANIPGKTATGAFASCRDDADCTLTDFPGCCACCKSAPYATPIRELEKRREACERKKCDDCPARVTCPTIPDRPASIVARCVDRTCVIR